MSLETEMLVDRVPPFPANRPHDRHPTIDRLALFQGTCLVLIESAGFAASTRAGGVTVLRGFPQGDSTLFKQRLAAIWRDSSEAGSLGIDPRLFRAFDIKQAPSFVMVAADFSPCNGFDCTDTLPPHDRLAGNVSVEAALETFADGGGPGARLARIHLARLREKRP